MRKFLSYILLFIASVLYHVSGAFAQISVTTELYTTRQGLAQNDINDMVKDSSGFLWLATENGLSRFDGYTFVNHKISTKQFNCSLNNQFEQLVVDINNNIWARNTMGQVLLYNQKSHEYSLFPDPKENRAGNYIYIKSILNGNDNGLWLVGAEKGLINIKTTNGKSITHQYCFNDSLVGIQVNNLVADADKNTWILTNEGIGFIANKENKISNTYFHKEQISVNDAVDLTNDIVFVCNKGKVLKYDKIKKRFSQYSIDEASNLINIYRTVEGTVSIVSNNKVLVYDILSFNQLKSYAFSNIEKSWQDENGNLWIYDNHNLQKINNANNRIEKFNISLTPNQLNNYVKKGQFPFASVEGNQNDLLSFISQKNEGQNVKTVCKTLTDNSGVYWACSNSNGLKKCVTISSNQQFIKCSSSQENPLVCALLEDNLGRIFVATTDQRLRVFDQDLNLLGFIDRSGKIVKNEAVYGLVSTIYQDRNNEVWIGSGTNLFKLTPRTATSFEIRQYTLDKGTPNGTTITDILEDNNGHIWVTTDGDGLQLLLVENNSYRFINRRNEFRNSYPPTLLKTNCIYEDNKGNIWLGSSEGLAIFSSDFPQLRFLKFFYYNPENSNMSTSVVSGLYQDKNEKMWIASYGGGVLKTSNKFELGETPEFISYNKENNRLGSDLVLSIEEDGDSYIWIATEKALIRLDKKSGVTEQFSFTNSLGNVGLGRQIFIRTRTNAFVLGAKSGFYYISPKSIQKNGYIPPMVYTRFLLFNKEIAVNLDNSPITSDINNAEQIVLNHKQNVFSIEYAALDYRNSSGIEYAYKLDNFEDNWNYVGSQRIASYTNLPPGEYLFRVKSTNYEGNWCDNDKAITIIVKPSFWQTGWAWALYLLLFAGVIGGVVYAYLAFYKMQAKMKLEQDISTMKMQFFTDISHELRTPLTLINAPLENVLANGNISNEDRQQLEIVHSNTSRMLRMLTQILDFRKLQSNKMRLRVEKSDLFLLIDKCCHNFQKMAENRNIKFNIYNHTNGDLFWVDRDKLDTVMFNLLSNAFKFTPEGKNISVDVISKNGNCIVKVADEGCGMPKDKLGVIFDRFSTLRPKSLTNQSGTGIGLALVKEILDLHKANIDVESQENIGTTFTFELKGGTEHFDDISADIIINDESMPNGENDVQTSDFTQDTTSKTKILVVEDNDDLRHFIVSILTKSFYTIEAANGREGLEKTTTEMPDFVITDIMMPIMDGIELVRNIRENESTSHIPVVLLTAKTDMQSKIECLKIGANDYITKPFSMVYLQTRIENILTERRLWQEKYRITLQDAPANLQKEDVNSIDEPLDSRDDEFMKKLVNYINEHIDDTNLSPDELANGLKISRWNLTCKVKSLVGQPPVEFIKEIRLNRAAQLIKEGELSMTQISYMIGMTDSRYFSRCFKQKFGMTPTEYKNCKN